MKLALHKRNQQRHSQGIRMSTRAVRRPVSYTPIVLFCLIVALLAMS